MAPRLPFLALLLIAALPARGHAQDSAATRPPDSLGSGATLPGAVLRRLPIDDPRHAFVLVPGVVVTSGTIGIADAPRFSIRASGVGQGNVYVDGAALRFQTFGTQGVGLAPNAIADASVITGVAPLFAADAGGGVVSYLTRGGGDKLAGDVRWDSDEPFGNGASVSYNRIEGTLGGPLPDVAGATFLLSTTLQGQLSSYRGQGAASVPTYALAGVDTTLVDTSGAQQTLPRFVQWSGECDVATNAGFECQGLRRPMDWSTARRAHGKIAFRYGTGSGLSFTALGGDLQQRFFPGQLAANPAAYRGRRASSAAAIVNWRQDLGRLRGGPLALDMNLSLVSHREMSGPLDVGSEGATRDPYLGIAFSTLQFTGLDVLDLPVSDRLLRDVRAYTGGRGVPYFGQDLDLFQGGRVNPYGLLNSFWPTGGIAGPLTDTRERRLQGRWSLDWRRGTAHRIAAGVDAETSDLSFYRTGNLARQIGLDVFAAQPSRLGLFVGDRIELGSAVADIGLRYDRITPGGDLPVVPAYISSSGAAWSSNAATDDTAYTQSVARVFDPARSRGVVSPRLRFAQRLTPTTTLRLGYSRTVAPPSWAAFFHNANSDLSFTAISDGFGRDVDFAVASLIEVGVRSTLPSGLGMDVALYRKDLPEYVNRFVNYRDPRDSSKVVAIPVLTVSEDAHVLGVDARIDWTVGTWFDGAAVYSVSNTQTDQGVLVPTADVTSHALALVAAVRVPADWRAGTALGAVGSGLTAVAMLRAASGAPYTRRQNSGDGTVAPGESGTPAEEFNASRLPWTKVLDLRLTKSFRAGGREWTAYADVRNALDFRNVVSLFAETGQLRNDAHRAELLGDTAAGTGEYGRLWNEAQNASAFNPDKSVDLSSCASWPSPLNCVSLRRVEARFGNGDGLYTLPEQARAFNAFYDDFFGSWRFYGAGRTARIGVQVGF